jgi:predicted nucleic acid-binding protein
MIRVVLDTSVLVSAVMTPTGPNAQVFDLVTEGKVRAYLTEAVLAEYYRVLTTNAYSTSTAGGLPDCAVFWKRPA